MGKDRPDERHASGGLAMDGRVDADEVAAVSQTGVRVTSSVVVRGGHAEDVETDVSEPGLAVSSVLQLRDMCEAQLRSETDPERKAQLHHALARLYEAFFVDLETALKHYDATLRYTPDHVASLRGARRVLTTVGRYGRLPALFDAEVRATRDPTARARLLAEKAHTMETLLGQPGPALSVYREALGLDPGNVAILRAIARGHRREGAWPDLIDTLAQLADVVRDASLRAAFTASRARLTESRLRDSVQAAALYEAALEADPHATSALAEVKRLSATQGRWAQLVAALRKEHQLCWDADVRQGILRAIARVEERHLRDSDAAVRTLEEALSARPEDRGLLSELARLHAVRGKYAEEAAALARCVDLTEGADEVAALCHRLGHLHEQRLNDPRRAATWWSRALAADPTHRAAADALSRLLAQRDDWSGVLRVLSDRAAAIADPQEQADLHFRMGTLLEERLGRPDKAVAQHGRALALEPGHHEAFMALSRLLTVAGRWHELVELYERAIARAPHDAEAIAWLFRIGGILEDRLDDASGALGAYERILQRDPAHLGALDAVRRAAERAGRIERAIYALRAEAELTADDDRKYALLHRAAVLTADHLGDVTAAERALEAILREAPRHRTSLEELARRKAAAGKWDELVAIYHRLLPLIDGRDEKVRLLHRIGEVCDVQLGRDAEAIAAYREALALDPHFEVAREALLAALERTESWAELAAAREERLLRLRSKEERAHAATELGELYEERLQDPKRALEAYEKAIEAVPWYRPASDARERLLTDDRDWVRLIAVLEGEVASSGDAFVQVQAALRAALVHAAQGSARALDSFRPVFSAQPTHVGALLAVEEIYERAKSDQGLAATYQRLADVIQDPDMRLATLAELAAARRRGGGTAEAVYRRILELAPDHPDALEGLAWAAERVGDTHTQLRMHARLAVTAVDSTLGAYHQTRAGELLLAQGDVPEALVAFRAAVALDPSNIAAARWQTVAALAANDPAAMQQAARHEHRVTRDRDFAVRVLLQAARVYRDADREDDAATVYEEALAMNPDDPEAAAGLMAMMMRSEQVPRLIELLTQAADRSADRGRECVLHLCVALLQANVRADLPAAIAAAKRAREACPNHATAEDQLAGYLEANGQWREAVQVLTASLARASGERFIEANLRLARLYERRLRDAPAAMKCLRVVLERDEDNPEALTALVRLERLGGNDEEALRLVRRLFAVVADDEVRRGEALSEMAELEKGRGHLAEAAAASLDAVAIQGPTGSAARVYRGLISSAPEYASLFRYGEALMTHLERARRDRVDLPATYRELARVFGNSHQPPGRLVSVLSEGVEVCPSDASISLALVRALRREGQEERALAELRRLLSVDVLEVAAWRVLADLVHRRGEPDGAAVALAPLVVLGQASAQEEQAVRGRWVRAGSVPPGFLAHSALDQLADTPRLESKASGFVRALSEVISKLEGVDYERWGVSRRDRIRTGEPHAVRAFADRVGRIFGVPEYDLFLVDGGGLSRTIILSGSPPALLVPASLEHAEESVLAFHLSRPLALLSRGLHALDHVDDFTLERIVVGAVRQFEPGFRLDPTIDEGDLEVEARRVSRAVGFFSRGRLQEAATSFAGEAPLPIPVWAGEMRRLAARAALLVADDLISVLATIGEELGPDNYASDLARFWVSDPAFRFRRAMAQRRSSPPRPPH